MMKTFTLIWDKGLIIFIVTITAYSKRKYEFNYYPDNEQLDRVLNSDGTEIYMDLVLK